MPHTSKRKLKPNHSKNLYSELCSSLERASQKDKTYQVLNEFLSSTEKEMLSKRLAVIALLSKGASIPTIADALSMSPTTIDRMSLKYERGDYKNVIENALGKKDIWNILEQIFTVGGIMPPKWEKGDGIN